MKKFLSFLFIFFILSFIFIAVVVFAFTKSPNIDLENTITLHVLKADVLVQKDNSSYNLVAESIDLSEGDKVKTDNSGRAEIIFGDGTVIRLDNNTELEINKADLSKYLHQDLNIKLLAGNIWVRIIKIFDKESQWQVETPTVVATARGTAFNVKFDGDNTELLVAESSVEVNNKLKSNWKSTIVGVGQKLKVDKKAVLNKNILNIKKDFNTKDLEWVKENLDLDKSFKFNVEKTIKEHSLLYLNAKPDSLLYKVQNLAEELRTRIPFEENKFKDLLNKRRTSEILWSLEHNKSLKTFNQNILKENLNKNKKLFNTLLKDKIQKYPEIKNSLNNIDRSKNIFDIKTFTKELKNLDNLDLSNDNMHNISNNNFTGFEALNTFSTMNLEEYKNAVNSFQSHPKEYKRLEYLAKVLNQYKDKTKILDSPEYKEYIKILTDLGVIKPMNLDLKVKTENPENQLNVINVNDGQQINSVQNIK